MSENSSEYLKRTCLICGCHTNQTINIYEPRSGPNIVQLIQAKFKFQVNTQIEKLPKQWIIAILTNLLGDSEVYWSRHRNQYHVRTLLFPSSIKSIYIRMSNVALLLQMSHRHLLHSVWGCLSPGGVVVTDFLHESVHLYPTTTPLVRKGNMAWRKIYSIPLPNSVVIAPKLDIANFTHYLQTRKHMYIHAYILLTVGQYRIVLKWCICQHFQCQTGHNLYQISPLWHH